MEFTNEIKEENIRLALQIKADQTLFEIKRTYEYVHKYKLENEQWFLDWLDEMNKISVDNYEF